MESQIISFLVGGLVAVLAWIFNRSLVNLEHKQDDHDKRIQACELVNGKTLVCLENVNEKLDDLKTVTGELVKQVRRIDP